MTAVFTFPALTMGFLFLGIPLLVHLINLLRHRRQRWAAMDFLLASYRKQKKWIVLRQMLLLLSRLAVAALLIALLAGWTGGRRLLGAFGGQTTHHVVVLDDTYSMGDSSGGEAAYRRALRALQDLTRRLAADDGSHQLTVLRASRAALAVRGGADSGDAVADLSAQTILADAALINRVMATEVSSIHADLIPAIDMAAGLLDATRADRGLLYIVSDFRRRDWESPERLAESLRSIDAAGNQIRMIDCAVDPGVNLAITDVSPNPDVWVAGVPVVLRVSVVNHGLTEVTNVPVSIRVIRYGTSVSVTDPTRPLSGQVDPQPAIMIDSLQAGEQVTKTFQVYIAEPGTHAVEVSLPDDVLAIDNRRSCVLPLTETERVLVIDEDPDGRGGYHVASVLDPGSQVRIGAIPDIQPPSFLRSATPELLARYRAVYLIDLVDLSDSAAAALDEYVRRGGGLCWFLGRRVNPEAYNTVLRRDRRRLLPGPLASTRPLPEDAGGAAGDLTLGDLSTLFEPLRGMGDAAFGLVRVSQSWTLDSAPLGGSDDRGPQAAPAADRPAGSGDEDLASDQSTEEGEPRILEPLRRRDGLPLVTQHDVGRGRVVTVLCGLDGSWTNWPGDPTFVVFLLQTNAMLWSVAAPSTQRFVDEPLERLLPADRYVGAGSWLPPVIDPPRVPVDVVAGGDPSGNGSVLAESAVPRIQLDPVEQLLTGGEVNELLRPGISEWMLTRNDGSSEVVPAAAVIRIGGSDLQRAEPVEIRRGLEPLDVRFVSSSEWSEENRSAGSSALAMILLGLLVGLLGIEQCLGYWASYHSAGGTAGRSQR